MSALVGGLEWGPLPTEAAVDIGCSFCRRGRDQVVRLIVQGHAAICSECLGEALAVLRAGIAQKPAKNIPELYQAAPKPLANGHAPPLTGHDGFTGECCDACGNFRVVRTGTCSVCLDCGSSLGGCS
jgi:hypothetical protein